MKNHHNFETDIVQERNFPNASVVAYTQPLEILYVRTVYVVTYDCFVSVINLFMYRSLVVIITLRIYLLFKVLLKQFIK